MTGNTPLFIYFVLTISAKGSLLLSSITFRYGYLVFAASIALAKLRRPLIHSFRTLHNAIRDDKYLVGKQLHNYTTAM